MKKQIFTSLVLLLFVVTIADAQTPCFGMHSAYGLPGILTAEMSPAFADLDNDNDLDVVAGNAYGNFYYFENTGTASAPSFATGILNPFGLTVVGSGNGSAPTLADIDGDGDLDLLSGGYDGNFYYYPNTGTASTPSFGAKQTNPFGLINVSHNTTPSFADMDDDGDFDLLVGEDPWGSRDDTIYYFRNTGTKFSPVFPAYQGDLIVLPTNPPPVSYGNKKAVAADLDNDGDLDVILAFSDVCILYENTGTKNAPVFDVNSINNPALVIATDLLASPALGDLDNDGDIDILVGKFQNGFDYFENIVIRPVAVVTDAVGGNNGSIDLTVTGGKSPYTYQWTDGGSAQFNTQDISGLAAGSYYVTITDANSCALDTQFAVDMQVGILDIKTGLSINAFPIPAKNLVILKLKTPDAMEITVSVFDISGKLTSVPVQKLNISGESSHEVDFSRLAAGNYFIKLTNSDNRLNQTIKIQKVE